jgi:hypothetical protein
VKLVARASGAFLIASFRHFDNNMSPRVDHIVWRRWGIREYPGLSGYLRLVLVLFLQKKTALPSSDLTFASNKVADCKPGHACWREPSYLNYFY